MWGQLAAAAIILGGQFIYHRWFEDKDVPDRPHATFTSLKASEGDVIPIVFGRVRVRAPVRAWVGKPSYGANGFLPQVYQLNQFYILGIPMDDGNGGSLAWGMWQGDQKFVWRRGGVLNAAATGVGNFEPIITAEANTLDGYYTGGFAEFLNGNPNQELIDGFGAASTNVGLNMTDTGVTSHLPASMKISPNDVPGYRGYMSIGLVGSANGGQWRCGGDGSIPPYSFEVESYRDGGGYPAVGIYAVIGQDCNPINAIYDIIVAKFGKMGLPKALVDKPSFQAAASTLYSEGHGYSRAFETAITGHDMINEILEQIDAVLYVDSVTGKIKIKLIRPDYDPATIPVIDKTNCDDIVNFAAGGWSGIVNKVRVVFTDRANDYNEGSAYASNPANAVGQDGEVREVVLRMPGVTTQALADHMADRELAARSRPLMRCSAIVNRSKLRLNPGDAVKLNWNDPDIAGIIFRVANVDRGTPQSNRIRLDLLQDYFYVHRGRVKLPPWIKDYLDDIGRGHRP